MSWVRYAVGECAVIRYKRCSRPVFILAALRAVLFLRLAGQLQLLIEALSPDDLTRPVDSATACVPHCSTSYGIALQQSHSSLIRLVTIDVKSAPKSPSSCHHVCKPAEAGRSAVAHLREMIIRSLEYLPLCSMTVSRLAEPPLMNSATHPVVITWPSSPRRQVMPTSRQHLAQRLLHLTMPPLNKDKSLPMMNTISRRWATSRSLFDVSASSSHGQLPLPR